MGRVVEWTELGSVSLVHKLRYPLFGASAAVFVLGMTLGLLVGDDDVGVPMFLVSILLSIVLAIVARVLPAPAIDQEVEYLVDEWIDSVRRTANQRVDDTYPLENIEFTKFEFDWRSALHKAAGGFAQEIEVTALYAKPKSLIFFSFPNLKVRVVPGCAGKASVQATGVSGYTLEEIFYSGVGALSSAHDEHVYDVPKGGCMGGTQRLVVQRDGFVIRSTENYAVNHNDANELRACMRTLNGRIQEYK